LSLADLIKEQKKEQKVKKKTVKKSNGIKPSFCGIIDAYLSNRNKFKPFKAVIKRNSVLGFHPSSMYNTCARKIAFQYLFEKRLLTNEILQEEVEIISNNSRLERIFDTGHIIHMLVQYGYLPGYKDMIKPSKFYFEVEKSVTSLFEKYFISGTADVVIRLQDNKKYVLDIKTARSSVFYSIKSIKDIQKSYLVQLNLYMLGLNIGRGLFYFWNKDTGEHKEIFVKLDRELIKGALNNAINGKAFLDGKKVPYILRECINTKGKYLTCGFSSLCFKCGNKPLDSIVKV